MTEAWQIVITETGGPEVLTREPLALDEPGAGEVRIRNTAIGVNFIDVYRRSGLYPLVLPSGLGSEGAGVIEAAGPKVGALRVGMRVAYLFSGNGAYATHVTVPASAVLILPDAIGDDIGAAALLKGMTAWMLIERIAQAGAGSTILVHSAAGGVGSILVPWLKALGATVIAHAGTPQKAETAKALGADHALSCTFDALAPAVRAITDGRGVDAVLDGVGQASWAASLAAVARRGMIVSYGNASGAVPPISPLELLRAGSVFLTRPTLFDYIDSAESYAEGGRRVFAMIVDGAVRVAIGQRFALADAGDAHRALEARQTIGSTILIP